MSSSIPLNAPGTQPLSTGPGDDHPDTTGNNTVLVVGGTLQSGVIGVVGDADRFRVELTAGEEYRFEMGGTYYPALSLFDSNGSMVGSTPGGSKSSSLEMNFRASISGSYYLDAFTTNGWTGSYWLSAESTTDDYPGSASTHGVVVPNGAPVHGAIQQRNEADYFRVTLQANVTYTFTVDRGASPALPDSSLRLRSAGGEVLATEEYVAGLDVGSSRLSYLAVTSGTYFLDVFSSYGDIGNYSLWGVMDDFPGGPETTAVLSLSGTPVSGKIEASGDADWFRVNLRAGVLYQFRAEGNEAQGPGALMPSLVLQTPNGIDFYGNDGGTGSNYLSQYSYMAPQDGTYFIQLRSRDNFSTGSYTVSAVEVADDHPSSTATNGTLQVNGNGTTGRIDVQVDTDYFTVALVAGTSYTFKLEGTGSLVDTELRLRGPDGTQLAANDDAGSKNGPSAITFTAPASGTYYLEAAGDGRRTGEYKLSAHSALALVSASPAPGATDVARSANLVLSFDRVVEHNDGHVFFQTANGQGLQYQVSLSDTSQVSINGGVVTINPNFDLTAGMHYTATFSSGAFKDGFGDVSGAIAITFNTRQANQAPTSANASLSTVQGTATSGRLPAATDRDGDSVEYRFLGGEVNGAYIELHPDGRYVYEAPAHFFGNDQFRFSVTDSQGAQAAYTVNVSVAPLPEVKGTAANDTLVAAAASTRYLGLDGNDRIATGPGADIVDGGSGTDTLAVPTTRASATIERRFDNHLIVRSSPTNVDKLIDIERLQFTDVSTALDLYGVAGQVARVIGTVFGTAWVDNTAVVGRYLALADSGVGGEALVSRALADLAFNAGTASRSNEDVVTHVHKNLVGTAPSAADLKFYTALITDGGYTQSSLLWWASNLDLTAQRIDLAGLVNTGLDFLPVAGS